MRFSLLLTAFGFAVTVCGQNDPYAGVLADLVYLKGNVSKLDTDIDAFANPTPPGTLTQALVSSSYGLYIRCSALIYHTRPFTLTPRPQELSSPRRSQIPWFVRLLRFQDFAETCPPSSGSPR